MTVNIEKNLGFKFYSSYLLKIEIQSRVISKCLPPKKTHENPGNMKSLSEGINLHTINRGIPNDTQIQLQFFRTE